MTSSNQRASRTERFIPAPTTQETSNHPFDRPQEIQTTPKGTDFTLAQEVNGLYYIKMLKAGGKVPTVCEERFTSFNRARRALEMYIASKE